jgi:hypothetical protein
MSGTSMAAPHVAGVCAKIRQWSPSISSELMKALLINTTIPLKANSDDALAAYANTQVGYGMVNAYSITHYYTGESERLLFGVGYINEDDDPLYQEWTITVPSGAAKLAVTMAYNDQEGAASTSSALNDDMDLILISPSGNYEYAYQHKAAGVTSESPLEKMVVSNPQSGTWTVRVRFTDSPGFGNIFIFAEQNYAVVAHAIYKTPQLQVTVPQSSITVAPGANFTIQPTVKNTGGYIAAGVTVQVTPQSGTFGGFVDKSRYLRNLMYQNDAMTPTLSLTAPSTPGTYTLTVTAEGINKGLTSAQTTVAVTVSSPTYSLSNDTPVGFSDIPKAFSFSVNSSDWCAVGIAPSSDHDIQVDDDSAFGSPYAFSTYGGTTRDFVAVNGHSYGSVTHYAQVYYGSASTYTIEGEWNIPDLSVGSGYSATMGSGEVLDAYEVSLTAGQQYQCVVDVTSGSGDLAVFIYKASRSSGGRSDADWSANSSGAGGDELVSFTADTTGAYGIVVVNENAGSANYTITVSQPTYTISGYVRTSGGAGISGVTINGLPSNPVTDGNGYYSDTVSYGWSGTATPSKTGYTFSPTSRTYSNVTGNQSNQDYAATKQFTNFDFESAVLVPVGGPYNGVDAAAALPGWTLHTWSGLGSSIMYNNMCLGSPCSAILDSGFSTPLQGSYTLLLQAGTTPFEPPYEWGSSISQTGQVPSWAKSLSYASSGGELDVAVGGQSLSKVLLSSGPNYNTYAVDVSAFSGTVRELKFTALQPPTFVNVLLDAIAFSTVPLPPILSRSPFSLTNSVIQGQNALDQTFEVWNSGGGTLSFTNTVDQPWLSVTPTNGSSTGGHDTIQVSYSTAGLPAGTHNATITIKSQVATNTIPVTLTVVLPATPPNIIAWGNCGAQCDVPVDATNIVGIAAGHRHSLALRANGRVIAWGDNSYGQTSVPEELSNVVAIASSWWHSIALRQDGSVVGWGYDFAGEAGAPAWLSNVVAIAAGGYHNVALRADGTVVCWGYDDFGQATTPTGLNNVVAIAAGFYHSLALRADGVVIAWGAGATGTSGDPNYGQATIPTTATNVVQIAAGYFHSLALKADGTVVGWGLDAFYEASPPAGLSNVVQIAGGQQFSLALESDGRFIGWGYNQDGEATMPAGVSNVVAICCGVQHSLALLGSGPPMAITRPHDMTVVGGGSLLLTIVAVGGPPINYQWQLNGTNIPGATNFWLRIREAQARDGGNYTVAVSNGLGGIVCGPYQVTVLGPVNDNFVDRATLTGEDISVTGWNVNASKEAGEPNHHNIPGGRSVWWTWTALRPGVVTLSTAGSSFDTVLAVYTGGAVNSLTRIASNDDSDGTLQSKVTFTVARGAVYQIAVDGYGASSGSIVLTLALTGPQLTEAAVTNGLLSFILNGTGGSVYLIQASSNLVNWLSLSTNTIPSNGFVQIVDATMTNHPTRFYRAVPQFPAGPIIIPATSGVITAPFIIANDYIYQPTETDIAGSGRAAYNFTITTAGNYVIQAMVDAPHSGANSFFLNIDAEPLDPSMISDITSFTSGFELRTLSWRGNGTFDNNQFVPKVFSLTPGTHQLIIRGREANTLLQSIKILLYGAG